MSSKLKPLEIVKFKITGENQVMMHSPKSMNRGSQSLGKKKIPTSKVEAEQNAYRDKDGNLYLPPVMFKRAATNGGRGLRFGKLGAPGVVSGFVFEKGEQAVLKDIKTGKPIKDYEIDERPVVIQRQRVLRSRPVIDNWTAEIEFEVDTVHITPESLEEVLNIGGRMSGVGDYRPGTKGHFGRFTAELITD